MDNNASFSRTCSLCFSSSIINSSPFFWKHQAWFSISLQFLHREILFFKLVILFLKLVKSSPGIPGIHVLNLLLSLHASDLPWWINVHAFDRSDLLERTGFPSTLNSKAGRATP